MPRPKAFDSDAALEAAMTLFWEQGYADTSIEDLVTAMGINRSSLYQAFGDKEGLFAAALARYETRVVSDVLAELERGSAGLAALRRYFSRGIDYLSSPAGLRGCLMTNTATELAGAPSGEPVCVHLERLEAAFVAVLRRARDRGELVPNAPIRDLARHLLAVVQGLQVIAKTAPPPETLRSIVRTALRSLPRARPNQEIPH